MSLFSIKDIYTGKREAMPQVVTESDYSSDSDLDKDLSKLLKVLPQRNVANREVAFWLDDICQSFAYIVIYTILGKGFKITCDNKKAEERIRNFNKKINVNNETIEDYIVNTWFDNLIHMFSLWRIAKNVPQFDESVQEVDLQRLAPDTISIKRDATHGWRYFVQSISNYSSYDNPKDFLKDDITNLKFRAFAEVKVADDPRLVIYNSFFLRPPMDAVVPFVTIKYWIYAFIRKFSEKMWAPPTIVSVGNEFGYPNGPVEMNKALSSALASASQLKNFSTAAFPGNTKVEIHELQNKGEAYLAFADKMDQHIMYGLFSSIATRESTGVYKGNATADEGTVRFMEGIRDKIENTLKRFYVTNIATDIKEEEIHFTWPELRSSSIDNIIRALEVAVKSGVFKDSHERRRAFAQVFTHLSEVDLTDAEAKSLQDEMITMQAPSQPEVTSVNAAKGKTTSKK